MTTATREIEISGKTGRVYSAKGKQREYLMTIIAHDGRDTLANDMGGAWRGIPDGQFKSAIQWRRAGEGESSRDGLWVVGGGQWRFGC